MCTAATLRSLWTLLLLGLVMTAAVLLLATTPASAHPCDEIYKEQKDRENCWWRYWNNQQTDEDRHPTPEPTPEPAAPTPTPAPAAVAPADCTRLHTVNPNETRLQQITDWFGLDLQTVATLNGIDTTAPLIAGTQICLEAGGGALNNQQTDEDRHPAALTPTPVASGAFCDVHYTTQKDRENCWWRYHHNLPLVPGDEPDALVDKPDNTPRLRRSGARSISPGNKPDKQAARQASPDNKPDKQAAQQTSQDNKSDDKSENSEPTGDLVFVPLTTEEWDDARRRFFGDD